MSSSQAPFVYLQRRETFSSSHRLHSFDLSEEENKKIFGKCNNPNGHGHNYTLLVTVAGRVNKTTGMVINLSDLKVILQEKVLSLVDHKNLDLDVPYFKEGKIPSTTENLAVFIWNELYPTLSDCLYEVKIHETENNVVVYRGQLQE